MEKLQQMAFDALEEAGYTQLIDSNDESVENNEAGETENQLPDGVERVENEDGSVTLTLSFSIDPEVQKEKAAAMAKGTKRDDQADVELDENGEPVSKEQSAEDAAPCDSNPDQSVFSDALDSLQDVATEDASRHNTPLANCRAKDPMYCPYHGTQATQKFLEDEISKLGGTIPGTIAVDTDDGHNFKVSITVPAGTNGQPYYNALSALMQKKGIKATPSAEVSPNQTDEVYEAKFNDPGHKDKDAQFDEWVDNLLEDYANDNNSPLDPNDLATFLGDYSDYKAMPGNIENTYNNSQTPPTQQDFAKAAAKRNVEEAYHNLRADVDMAHVKSVQDAQAESAAISAIRSKAGDWWNSVQEAAHIWNACGIRKGSSDKKYPQQAQPIRERFHKKYSSFYRSICAPYDNAVREYSAAITAASPDMKQIRRALHKMNDYANAYEDAFPSFKKIADEYTNAANAYAKQQGVTVPPYQKQPWAA